MSRAMGFCLVCAGMIGLCGCPPIRFVNGVERYVQACGRLEERLRNKSEDQRLDDADRKRMAQAYWAAMYMDGEATIEAFNIKAGVGERLAGGFPGFPEITRSCLMSRITRVYYRDKDWDGLEAVLTELWDRTTVRDFPHEYARNAVDAIWCARVGKCPQERIQRMAEGVEGRLRSSLTGDSKRESWAKDLLEDLSALKEEKPLRREKNLLI